jgi:ribonucleoside-diphosphate reductase alpha chain
MTEVLGAIKEKEAEGKSLKITKTVAPNRPKSLNCDVHHITVDGHKWIVIVGLIEDDPYEVFAFKTKTIHIPTKIKDGILTKVKRGRYDLDIDGFIIEDLGNLFETEEEEALTRMISTALRHGADIQFIFEQLSKAQGIITSFSKAIGRTLKKYLTNGAKANIDFCDNCNNQGSLVYQEGCVTCQNCGWSAC